MRKLIILFLLIPTICYAASMSGIGDMRKSVYDTDKDGVVEYADNVSDADFGDVTVTAGDWAVEDDSHAHTGASLSGIDISEDTNLTAGDYITLNDDDLDVDNMLNTITTPDANITAGVAITFADTGIMTISEAADTITFDATEVDGSTTNEINTIQGDDNVASSGLAISIDGAGIVTTDVVGDVLTVTGTDAQDVF